jgi:hypothetical protein
MPCVVLHGVTSDRTHDLKRCVHRIDEWCSYLPLRYRSCRSVDSGDREPKGTGRRRRMFTSHLGSLPGTLRSTALSTLSFLPKSAILSSILCSSLTRTLLHPELRLTRPDTVQRQHSRLFKRLRSFEVSTRLSRDVHTPCVAAHIRQLEACLGPSVPV